MTHIFTLTKDGSLLLIPHILYHKTASDQRNFHALYTRFEAGGRRIVMEPGGLQVVDWPWPVKAHANKIPRTNWLLELRFDGNVVKVVIDGLLLCSVRSRKRDSLGS